MVDAKATAKRARGRPKGSKNPKPPGKKKGRDGPTAPRHIKALKDRATALEFRIQGWSMAAIAESMNVAPSYVSKLLTTALDELHADQKDVAAKYLEIEIARLDVAQIGIANRLASGDPGAVDLMLKLQERRLKLLGHDTLDPKTRPNTVTASSTPDGAFKIVISEDDSKL